MTAALRISSSVFFQTPPLMMMRMAGFPRHRGGRRPSPLQGNPHRQKSEGKKRKKKTETVSWPPWWRAPPESSPNVAGLCMEAGPATDVGAMGASDLRALVSLAGPNHGDYLATCDVRNRTQTNYELEEPPINLVPAVHPSPVEPMAGVLLCLVAATLLREPAAVDAGNVATMLPKPPRPVPLRTGSTSERQYVGGNGAFLLWQTKRAYLAGDAVVMVYEGRRSWRKYARLLLTGICAQGVHHVVGALDMRRWPVREWWKNQCTKDHACDYWMRRHKTNLMARYIWVFDVLRTRLFAPDTWVFLADATNLHIACSPGQLVTRRRAIAEDVLINAEVQNWAADASFRKAIDAGRIQYPSPPAPTILAFPSTSLMSGRARHVVGLIQRFRREWEPANATEQQWHWCCPSPMRYVQSIRRNGTVNCFLDRACLHTFFVAGFHRDGRGPSVAVDYWARLSVTTQTLNSSVLDLRSNHIRVDFRGLTAKMDGASEPCFAHVSGPNGKDVVWNMLRQFVSPWSTNVRCALPG